MKGRASVQLLLSAGEASGDEILSSVLEKLVPCLADASLFGIGGEKSEKYGFKSLVPIHSISANGFFDIWARLYEYVSIYFSWKRKIRAISKKQAGKALAILVDFPGLNKFLLKLCRGHQIPVYYISPPQTWPYKNKNIKAFSNCQVQLVYPMDLKCYEKITANVSFGHFQNTDPKGRWTHNAPLRKAGLNYLLCPGSRINVIKRNLIFYCRLIETVVSPNPSSIYLLTLPGLKNEILKFIEKSEIPQSIRDKLKIVTHPLSSLPPINLALCYPGTMSLKLALRNIPHALLALVDPITFFIGKKILKENSLSLANGILEENYFLEWAGIKAGREDFILLREFLAKAMSQSGRAADLALKLGSPNGAEIACQKCLQLLQKVTKN